MLWNRYLFFLHFMKYFAISIKSQQRLEALEVLRWLVWRARELDMILLACNTTSTCRPVLAYLFYCVSRAFNNEVAVQQTQFQRCCLACKCMRCIKLKVGYLVYCSLQLRLSSDWVQNLGMSRRGIPVNVLNRIVLYCIWSLLDVLIIRSDFSYIVGLLLLDYRTLYGISWHQCTE